MATEKTYVAKYQTEKGDRFMLFYAESKALAVDHAECVAAGGKIHNGDHAGIRATLVSVKHYPKTEVNEATAGKLLPYIGDVLA